MFSANTSQVSNDVKYIEDFFSAWLRTGTGSSQTVTTGIKENTGALVISKSRSAATDWAWYDTFRGATKDLASNTTAAETTQSQGLTAFNTDGHTWGTLAKVNTSGATYVDFVLKPTPKFFDVVTYTGDGTTSKIINHNLGSVPGCIIVKPVTLTGGWLTYHRSLGNTTGLYLNTTAASVTSSGFWNNTDPTNTQFTVGSTSNDSGQTFVAYLFAHDAGGFGLTGTDNVISCGSFTTDGSGNATVNLGYEPQWLLVKNSQTAGTNWQLCDNMRGWTASNSVATLNANTSGAEVANNGWVLSGTGFSSVANDASRTYIYIAIRRGPMKTPTSGTSVFAPVAVNNATSTLNTINFPLDLQIAKVKDTASNICVADRLRGVATTDTLINNPLLITSSTSAELTDDITRGVNNVGFLTALPFNSTNAIYWNFQRAPGFFDEVCYKGTSSVQNVTHNLTVAPEIIIVKKRDSALTSDWFVYSAPLGNAQRLRINSTSGSASTTAWNSTNPTATQWTMDGSSQVNETGYNFVSYLFASCPGVSKVGSYTGNGSSQTINCGFTGGARFVLIKRTDSTGDWYVWDTARGIVSANDPRLSLNSTAAEVTTDDSIDPDNSGFIVNQVTATNINVSSATYIYLAIA